jgi:hypothetical protein
MARNGQVLHKHVYAVMRAIGDIVPRLDDEARRELFDVLRSVLQYLQEHEAKRASAEFQSLEAELQAAFKQRR